MLAGQNLGADSSRSPAAHPCPAPSSRCRPRQRWVSALRQAVFHLFSLFSAWARTDSHPSPLRARLGTLWAAGAPEHPPEPVPACPEPVRASPRTLPATTHPCALSQSSALENSKWGTQSGSCQAGAARSRSTAGTEPRRVRSLCRTGSTEPGSEDAQSGQRPRPGRPGSTGMPDGSCGTGALLLSRCHVAVPPPGWGDTRLAAPCSHTLPPPMSPRAALGAPGGCCGWGGHSTFTPQLSTGDCRG